MLKRADWQALQEAQKEAKPIQLEFSFAEECSEESRKSNYESANAKYHCARAPRSSEPVCDERR